jgi:hypothetical protein
MLTFSAVYLYDPHHDCNVPHIVAALEDKAKFRESEWYSTAREELFQ